MTPLTTQQIATWRTHPHRAEGYLFILAPAALASGVVTQETVEYPTGEVSVSWTGGDYIDVQTGATVLFGTTAGADDLGRARVRAEPTANTLYIGWSSQGGRAGEIVVEKDAYITVLDLREMWAKIPTPDPSSEDFLKDFTAVGTYGTYRAPIANGGAAVCDFVGDDGYLNVSLSAANSLDLVGDGLVYTWNIKDGTFTGGSTASDESITFRVSAGFRYVRLTINDGHHTAYHDVPVTAMTQTGSYAPVAAVVEGRTVTPQGQTINFRILDDIPETTYPNGTLVIFIDKSTYGGLDDWRANPVRFVGWLTRTETRSSTDEYGLRHETALGAEDISARLKALPGFTQTVRHAASPSNWREMAAPDLRDYLCYLAYWHSTAPEIADFIVPDLSDYPFPALESGENNIFAQINDLARAVRCELTCRTDGTLKIVKNPLLLPKSERSSDVFVALVESDYTGLDFEKRTWPAVHWVKASGIKAVNTISEATQGYFARAPGKAPGQGERKGQLRKQLLPSANPQAYLEQLTAAYYARLNNVYGPLRLDLAHAGDIWEPAGREWVTISLNEDAAAQRGLTFTQIRALIDRVTVRYDWERGIKETSIECEVETTEGSAAVEDPQTVTDTSGLNIDVEYGGAGLPAFTIPQTNLAAPSVDLDDTGWPMPEPDLPVFGPYSDGTTPDADEQPVRVMVVMDNGRVARWTDMSEGTPTWELCESGLSGISEGYGLAFDPWSQSAFLSTDAGLWLCTNPWGTSPSWSLVNASWDATLRISYVEPGYMVGIYASGIRYSFDFGSTMETLETISYLDPADLVLAQGSCSPGKLVGYLTGEQIIIMTEDGFQSIKSSVPVSGQWMGTGVICPVRVDNDWNRDGKYLIVSANYNTPSPDNHFLETQSAGEENEDEEWVWSDPKYIETLDGRKWAGSNSRQQASWGVWGHPTIEHIQIRACWNNGTSNTLFRQINQDGDWNQIRGYVSGVTGLDAFNYNGLWFVLWGFGTLEITADAFDSVTSIVSNLFTLTGNNNPIDVMLDQFEVQ